MQIARLSGGLSVRAAMVAVCLACGALQAPAQTAYYLNDASTNGNFYTTAPGNDAHPGTNAAAPMRTLTNLLATHTLGPGDTVYIDTGTYGGHQVNISVAGTNGNPITFQGAPKQGATVFNRGNSNEDMFHLANAHHVHFKNMTVTGARYGFTGPGSLGAVTGNDGMLENVVVRNNVRGFRFAGNNWHLRNTIFVENGMGVTVNIGAANIHIERSVFWKNGNAVLFASANSSTVRNSVFAGGQYAFVGGVNVTDPIIPLGDYNIFWNISLTLPGLFCYISDVPMPNSAYADPQFADPDNLNFHPKSVTGRHDPLTGNIVTDSVHSILIDFGDPVSTAWTNEPDPNGGRINAGAFGGTDLASMSRTNPWLHAITFSDGGLASGATNRLRWNYGAFDPGETVTVQYQADGWPFWLNIATGIPVTNRVHNWDVTGLLPMAASWRVVLESDPSVESRSRQRFSINGAKASYYVNDENTSGNVYTTEAGDDVNDGFTPATPMRSITNLFARYNFGGHDIVYVDTGVYSNYTLSIGSRQAGSTASGRFTIRGSTNLAAGGTLIDRNSSGQEAMNISGPKVNIEQLTLKNGSAVIIGANSVALRDVRVLNMAASGSSSIINIGGSENVTFERCIVRGNGVGIRGTQAFTVDGNVMWSNSAAFNLAGNAATNATIHHTVIAGGNVFHGDRTAKGDYNILWNASIGPIVYPNLNVFQKDVNSWWNSATLDPKFKNPNENNFFPRSATGRYDPDQDEFVADADHSPLIDFGNPASTAWTNEPDPNGGRLNIGAYGGTPWASKSRTNEWLQVLTYNAGGTLNAEENNWVYWTGGNFSPGATVRIELAAAPGDAWQVAATGILASAGSWQWDYDLQGSTTSALWRVVYEGNTNISSQTASTFLFRNGPFLYYVNNDSTEGNVYTTAPGSDANPGISPTSPKATLKAILDSYAMEPGDIIYIDTGVYTLGSSASLNPVMSSTHSGSTNQFVYLLGSTNYAAGGTVFRRSGTPVLPSYGLHLDGAQYVKISDIRFRNHGVGLVLNNAQGSRLVRVHAYENREDGIRMANAPGTVLERVVSRQNTLNGIRITSGHAGILHSVLWHNNQAGVRVEGGGTAFMTNCVIVATAPTAFGYHAANPDSVVANFNSIHVESNAVVGFVASLNRNQDTLSAWSAVTGQDRRSLEVDPLFANPPSDFHLKTRTPAGRYDPVLGGWVVDEVTSRLIDAGDPASDYFEEPAPDGGRVNIGLYGNTPEASKGRETPWLHVASLRQGGWVKGTTTLHWVAGNLDVTDLVRVEFSPDGGESWSELADDIPATDEVYSWNTTATGMTVAGLWRVSLEADSSVRSHTTNFFVIRNEPVAWYVNNAELTDTVWATGPGSPTNWVATPERPLDLPATVFDRYDVEPGDVIYVDTGHYSIPSSVRIHRRAGGAPGNPALVLGSTHCSVPGSFLAFNGGTGLDIGYADSIIVSNIVVEGAATGVRVDWSRNVELSGVRAMGSSASGIHVSRSTNVVVRRSVMAHNTGFGLFGAGSGQIQIQQSIVWSNMAGGIAFTNSASIAVSNSVITASGTTNRLYSLGGVSGFRSDYNNLQLQDNAEVALFNGMLRRQLTSWQAATTNDLRSLTHPPLFADPANGDFHLRSEAGRYDPSECDFVLDGETSPMIDAAHPAASFGEETEPNGGRMNMGLYGNHPEASRTPSDPRLLVVSLYQGGSIRDTNDLYWIATGSTTGHLVSIQFSTDSGENWVNLATNVPASLGVFQGWDTTLEGTFPRVFWRVISEDDPSVLASNAAPFQISNSELAFYVNNDSTNGNVYTTAPGNLLHDGTDPSTPLPSLADVLNRYQVQPGDWIYIDTGEYVFPTPVAIGAEMSGFGTNYIHIMGSTNYAAGGTVINGQMGGPALRFTDAETWSVSHLRFTNALRGFDMRRTRDFRFNHIEVDYPDSIHPGGDRYGFRIRDSEAITLNRVSIHGLTNIAASWAIYVEESTDLLFQNGVLWSNTVGIEMVGETAMAISNSVIGAFGPGRVGIRAGLQAEFTGDYNNFYARNGALPIQKTVRISHDPDPRNTAPRRYASVEEWRADTGRGTHMLGHDPLFGHPESGNFFLKSQAGRYQVATDSFLPDGITSPLIDAGDPAAEYDQEPDPNGGRINIGLYGNTEWASKTPEEGALTVLSFNDGGVAKGANVTLRWLARGMITNETVRIRFSDDGGSTWNNLVTNIPAIQGLYDWNSTQWPSTLFARWRVEGETSPEVLGVNELFFAVRNTNFAFYVNDGLTNGNVFTTAIGDTNNTGLSADSPLPGLADVFSRYDLGPGDTVYVDTGVYDLGGNFVIRQRDSGFGTNRVRIIGSPNRNAGGTVFTGGGLRLDATRGIKLENIIFDWTGQPAGTSVHVFRSSNTLMRAVDVIGGGNAFHIENSMYTHMIHCSARNVLTNGLWNEGSARVVWEQGLLWSNRFSVRGFTGTTVSNSVLAAFGPNAIVYIGRGSLNSDYNNIQVRNGAWIARESIPEQDLPNLYRRLGNWAQSTGRDRHSLAHDPLFADPVAGDFHLKTQAPGGRYVPGQGHVATDEVTSPLIDAASPSAPFGQEPLPNGGRANIGRFGNTAEASHTPTNAFLHAVSLYDGGTVRGTNVTFHWLAQGAATEHAARVEFSPDNGASWQVLASNISAGTSFLTVDVSQLQPTVLARWRVISEANESLVGQPPVVFAIRTGPIPFYVNDGFTNGNVYTTAPGSPAHTGTTPTDPKDSIQDILMTYDLEPGDVIYVDTGQYDLMETITFTSLDAGSIASNLPVRVIGSTNYAAGGSVLNAGSLSTAIDLTDAEFISLHHLTIRNGLVGIRISNSPGFDFRHMRVEGASTGINILPGSANGHFRNCLIRDATGPALLLNRVNNIVWDHGVLWSNAMHSVGAVHMIDSSASFSNSVFSQFGTNAVYSWDRDTSLQSDYNFFHLNENSYVSRRTYPVESGDAFEDIVPLPMMSRSVAQWVRDYGRDWNSLAGDPLFADPVAGDFHPQSEAGRYVAGWGWTNDAHTSLLIDAGSPSAVFSEEPYPHGYRVNIGLYGNTPEASRSPSPPRLAPVSLRDGGYAKGDSFYLNWRAYGMATGDTVRLDFSPDGGSTWETMVTNIEARVESLFWDTTPHSSTWLGAWRIMSESDTNVYGRTETRFAVRNQPLALYINDASTNGLVYTTAAGSVDGDGTSPATPRNSLQSILDDYDLEPGDIIYMDTGSYIINETISWTRFNAWSAMTNLAPLRQGGVSVTLQGSTNEAAGGTRITRIQSGTALELVDAYGVQIRNIRFRNEPIGTGRAVRLNRSPYAVLEWIRSRDALVGLDIRQSDQVRIRHTLVEGSHQYGLLSWESRNTDFRQGILWSNTVGARVQGGGLHIEIWGTWEGALTVENSVLGVLKAGTAGLEREDDSSHYGVLFSDHNLFHVVPGAYVGRRTGTGPGGQIPIVRLSRWNEETGQDAHSLGAEPEFANPNNGDFHPRSPYGRYEAGIGFVTNSLEEFSPLIDAGNPALPFDQEPDPNGGRVNIGLYGNTPEASKSPGDGVLQVVTFNDGGSGFSNIWLRWVAAGPVAEHPVSLEFSSDGGMNWTNIAQDVLAADGEYLWDSVPYGRAIAGVWRITSQADSNLYSSTENFFRLRQDGTIPYYVNHPDSDGDVYTTAPGHDSNSGWLPHLPKASLQSLIDDNELEAGDVVYIDTGVYEANFDTLITIFESGVSNNPVIFRGSTNMAAGGTVMDRVTGVGAALYMDEAQGIRIEHMAFRNAGTGVRIRDSEFISLYNVKSSHNAEHGISVEGSDRVRLENMLLWNNAAQGLRIVPRLRAAQVGVHHAVIWGSPFAVFVDQSCSLQISNSVLRATGFSGRIFRLGLGVADIQSDYNNIIRIDGAVLAERSVDFGGNEYYPRMLDWQRFLGQDFNSLSHAPEFANPGAGDFHPMSIQGRWLETNWVTDEAHSPMIDTGSPFSPYDREPEPHGGRVNIGFYGNTPEASLSQTNPWLLAVSVNDGGVVSGTQRLYWVAGNMETSDTVSVEFAPDGVEYHALQTGIPAYESEYLWDASALSIKPAARWRVVSESHPGVENEVDMPFTVKNEILIAYVNDTNTLNTVYTTAPGHPDNDGLSPGTPLANPAQAIAKYHFGPGDVIYIDTGEYVITEGEGMRLGLIGDTLKSGIAGWPLIIRGSTNVAAGGSRLIGTGNNQALLTIKAGRHIEVHDLRFSNAQNGVLVENSEHIALHYVDAYQAQRGFDFNNARNILVSRAAAYNNSQWGYRISGGDSDVSIRSSVAVSNPAGAVSLGASSRLDIRHSILDASAHNALAYSVHGTANLSGDYNMIWPGANTRFARDITALVDYRNLRAWQRARNMDYYSLIAPPLFANPGAGDFHLWSQKGRFDPVLQTFVTDLETSWAIDAGDPSVEVVDEPEPNGGRVNIGRYGNTSQASMTVTNPVDAAIWVVSLRDGGTVGFTHELYWLARGLDAGETVRLEYSLNNGVTWYPIATNVPASDQTYYWDFSEEESTPLALWRVEVESNPAIQDQSSIFTIRNGPITYYVNVTNTTGDVYARAPGAPNNDGITADTPVDTISAIIERYQLDSGDTIYVDTGRYHVHTNIRILVNDSGDATNRVVIQGSTNWLGGGTVLDRGLQTNEFFNATAPGIIFDLFGARYLEIRDFIIENADIGIRIDNPTSVVGGNLLRNLLIRDGGSLGVSIGAQSTGNRLERVVITRHLGSGITHFTGLSIESSVIWSNKRNAVNVAGVLSISNSVLHAMNASSNVIYNVTMGSVHSDYNALFADRGASYARMGGFLYSGLPQWSQATMQDRRSLATDPLFADPANDDYHLLSETGRYIPGWGWTNDAQTSYLIDTGSPQSDYSKEPEPHGNRRNIGLYGNTSEASKSREDPWLLAITALGGGRMNGIIPFYWAHGNLHASNRVRLDYSLEMGENWQTLAVNVPIGQNGYFWDSMDPEELISPVAQWRVVLEADTNVYHTADATFGLNGPFTFYVNDDSTNQNVFTTAPGNDDHLGIFPHAPKATIKSVIDRWDMEPEDRILVDTGTYVFDTNNLVVMTIDNQGAPGRPVTIRGSTNAPGTVLDATILEGGVFFEVLARYVVLEDMQVRRGAVQGSGTNIVFRNMRFTNSSLRAAGAFGKAENVFLHGGSLLVTGDDVEIRRSEVRDGTVTLSGNRAVMENSLVSRNEGFLVTVTGVDTTLRNNTIVGGRVAVRQTGSASSLNLYNNILIADRAHHSGAQVIQRVAGTLTSDYNLLLGRNGAWIGNADGGLWERLVYWQQRSGQDLNSISAEPLFANEAARDYHLKSSAGRYFEGIWVTDMENSPAIDAGNPVSSFDHEPDPNGSRINLGAYGNTEQASKTSAAPWLNAMSFNDGGAVRGTNVVLRWLARGTGMDTNTVTLQYRPDPAGGWVTIVAGLPAASGTYTWDTTLFDSSLFARWRVVLDSDPGVYYDETDSLFSVRNDPQDFFVNNGVPDIYTTVPGLHGNDGLTPATPKLTLTNLLATYDTVGGDVIYMDTGAYNIGTVDIIWSRGGTMEHGPMVIQGSTNLAAGGTVLHRTGVGHALNVQASHVVLRDLAVHSALRGIWLNENRYVGAERIFSYSNTVGIYADNVHNVELRNMRIWKNELGGIDLNNVRTAIVENVTFVANSNRSFHAEGNILNTILQNNIFVVTHTNETALTGAGVVSEEIFIDYNIYDLTGGATIHSNYTDLRLWQLSSGHDFRSALTNPMLQEAESGNFHLKSEYGRYDPAIDQFVFTDTETSWAIGRGNPHSPFDRQPEPTAGRINLGAFGNTEFASMGSTNATILTRTLNEGIIIDLTNNLQPLVWAANHIPTNLLVAVQFSGDGGTTWHTIQDNVDVYREYVIWTNTPFYNTYRGYWRVIGTHDSVEYSATNAEPFEIIFREFEGIEGQFLWSGRQAIQWRGAWDETYRVEYTEDGYDWTVAPSGPGPYQQNPFTAIQGGDQFFEDIGSTNVRFRAYRVIWETEE